MTTNNLRFLSKVIYNLKRDYGASVDFYKRLSSTYDVQTGVKAVVREKNSVRRAVILPQNLAQKFLYDAVLLKQDRPFAYGGFFSVGDKIILVDRKDLPRGYQIEIQDYLIIHERRYEVKDVDEFEGGYTYVLTVTELKGLELSKIEDRVYKQTFTFSEQVLVLKGRTGFADNLSFQDTIVFILDRFGYRDSLTLSQDITVLLVPRQDVSNSLTFNEVVDFGLFLNDYPVQILYFTEVFAYNLVRVQNVMDALTFVQGYSLSGTYASEEAIPYVSEEGLPYIT